jgi:hypothetical protein
MPFLTAIALHFRNRQALHTDVVQGRLDILKLERLDDRFDFFHIYVSSGRIITQGGFFLKWRFSNLVDEQDPKAIDLN